MPIDVSGSATSLLDIVWHNTAEVITLQLAPGQHTLWVLQDIASNIVITVTSEGLVTYEAALDAVLTGQGTSALQIIGCDITLDASSLSGADSNFPNQSGVLLANTLVTANDWAFNKTLRLVPGSGYTLQQGLGAICSFTFAVESTGAVSYETALDVAGGRLSSGQWHLDIETLGVQLDIRRKRG